MTPRIHQWTQRCFVNCRMLAEYRQLSKGKVNANQFHEYLQQAINVYKNCFASFSMRQCAFNVTLANSVKVE